MNYNIFIFILLGLILHASCLSLQRHENYPNTCFFIPLGEVPTDPNFNYTITRAWTSDQLPKFKNGTLKASDFVNVKGWTPYRNPNDFFTNAARQGPAILLQLQKIRNVLKIQDALQYGTFDLQFAFGNPSKAALYKVPQGKALIAIRFQASVTSNLSVGTWSVLLDLVDEHDLNTQLKTFSTRIPKLWRKYKLTPLGVARSLNVISSFVQSSVLWSLKTPPSQGTIAPVSYQTFLVVIRAGQEILAGPIHDGQSGVIQVKDIVKDRSSCVA